MPLLGKTLTQEFSQLKIAKVETPENRSLRSKRRRDLASTLVRVRTDEGISGLGEVGQIDATGPEVVDIFELQSTARKRAFSHQQIDSVNFNETAQFRPDLEGLGIARSIHVMFPTLQQFQVPFAFGTVRHELRKHIERFGRHSPMTVAPAIRIRSRAATRAYRLAAHAHRRAACDRSFLLDADLPLARWNDNRPEWTRAMSHIDELAQPRPQFKAGGRTDRQRTTLSADLAASAWQVYSRDKAADRWFGGVNSDRG